MIKENIYNTTDFDSIFEYNEAYPSCLVWKIDIYAGMFKSTKNASSGTPAGFSRVFDSLTSQIKRVRYD